MLKKLREKIKKGTITSLMCFGISSPHCPDTLKNIYHEYLTASDYTKKSGYLYSKLILNLKIEKPCMFICPRCKTGRNEPEHGKATKCDKCNLGFLRYGNCLYIWETDTKSMPFDSY